MAELDFNVTESHSGTSPKIVNRVVIVCVLSQTKPTEFIVAIDAPHLITPFVFLNDHGTHGTLLEVHGIAFLLDLLHDVVLC